MNALATDTIAPRIALSDIPDELKPADHILKRWAASIGDGTPDYDEVVLSCRVTPLPGCVAEVVDKLVLRSPYRTITEKWYRTPVSVEVIAREMRTSQDVVRPTWMASLRHYRIFFETSPLSDLRKLALIDVRERARAVLSARWEFSEGA